MERLFVQTTRFSGIVDNLGISEAQIHALENEIMHGGGNVIVGTGGLRKIRMSRQGGGKSGGYRVLLADYADIGVCVLITLFAKNVRANVTAAEARALRKMKAILDAEVRQTYG